MTGKELYLTLRNSQNLPNAFNDWKNYRQIITDFIIKHSEPDKSVAILGAGKCNDIDLLRLKDHFYTISLFDRDEKSMQEALTKYHLTNSSCVEIHTTDFIGITDEMYCDYADYMINELKAYRNNSNIKELSRKIVEKLDEIFKKIENYNPQLGIQQYDYIACFGVHSQLLNIPIWLWSIGLSNINQTDQTVEDRIKLENTKLVKKLNDEIILLARKSIFLGCEMQRAGMSGAIEGALQAIEDIQNRNNHSIKLDNIEMTTWPFNPSQNIIFQIGMMNIAIK